MKTMTVLQKLDGFHGAEVFLVGGFVRDLMRRKGNDDLDIVVRKLGPPQIKAFLDRYGSAKYVHTTFGVPIILFRASGDSIEAQIVLPRDKEGHFSITNTLNQDAEARDFTINAMYLPINFKSRNDLIDFFGGYKDIKNRVIRSVGDPYVCIEASPIRMMRAISLAARTRYRINNPTMQAIFKRRDLIRHAPVEGIREEFNKILLSSKPSQYLKLMRKTGLMEILIPELASCAGVKQDSKYHKFDVFKHCLYTCDYIERDLVLRLAALLHDIGKPETREEHGDRTTFHKHEVVSVSLAKGILERLRYKKEISVRVIHLIRLHMYHYTRDFSDAAVRRFIKKAGIEKHDLEDLGNLPLFKLRRAERKGNGFKTIPVTERQHDFEQRIIDVYASSTGLEIKDLDINGEVLMSVFNLGQGQRIGEILNYLLEQVLENPKVNTQKELIKLAAEYLYYKMS